MATYLIDYENVNKDGLNGVSKLTEKDRVIIFYSERADRMTFGLHRRLNETKAQIEYKKVDVGGHNALDFQLATYLGFLIANDSSEEYCVVSNDRGFEYLTGFWRKPQYDVCLAREIAYSPQAEERREERRQAKKQKKLDTAAGSEGEENGLAGKTPAYSDAANDGSSEYQPDMPAVENISDYVHSKSAEYSEKRNGARETGKASVTPLRSENGFTAAKSDVEKFDAAFGAQESEEKTNIVFIGRHETSLTKSGNNRHAAAKHESAEKNAQKSAGSREEKPENNGNEAAEASAEKHDESKFWFRNGGQKDNSENREEEQNKNNSEKTTEAAGPDKTQKKADDSSETKDASGHENVPKEASEKEEDSQKKAAHKHNSGKRRGGRGTPRKKTLTPEEEKRIKEVRENVDVSHVSGESLTDTDFKNIAAYINKYKTKQGVNNALVRRFGNQRAGEIYQMIKPMLKDKKSRNNHR